MMDRLTRTFVFVFCTTLFLLGATSASAQTASVTGTVTDVSGAIVVGVHISATNTETGASRQAVSDDDGIYNITNLTPGTYNVAFEMQGFKVFRFDKVTLTVSQSLTLDVKLNLGTIATVTEVSAQVVPDIELENAQISNLVDSKRITDLPLLTRDPYQLILLSPGVIQSNTGLGGFSVNGTSERNNNFLLDGVDNNDTEVPGIASGLNALNPDSTQEFRVITNNYAPEFGRNNGAVIEVITKSGTNDFHGTAYEFGRYSALGARDFFNPATGPNGRSKDPYVRNDFGVSMGGRIIRDKTFWFANYEGQRYVTSVNNVSTVPTAAFKTGKFIITQDAQGNPLPNPVAVDVSQPNSPNNTQGLSLDANIQKILALYPNPNGPAVNDISGLLNFPSSSRQRADDVTVKIDHKLTSKHSLTGRYAYNRFTDPNPFHADFLPGGLGATSTYQRTQSGVIGLTSTLTNNVVNEFHFGANRTNLQFNCAGTSVFDSFGNLDSVGTGPDYGLPNLSGFGCSNLGDSNGQARFTGTYQTVDNISWSRGRHLFKFGSEFRAVYSNSFDGFGTRQQLGFNAFTNNGISAFTTGNAAVDSNNTLQDQTFGLLGFVNNQTEAQFFNFKGVRLANDLRGFRQREWGVFAQDSWKLRSNLTVTYGLRWEYYGVPFEVNNNLSNLFADPSGPAPFTFTQVGPGTGKNLYANDFKNFEPRIGIAWDPFKNGKTSVRAGYGIYHDRVFGNLVGNARGNPPFQQSFSQAPFAQTPSLVQPTTVPTSTVVTNIDPNTGLGGEIFATLFDPNFKTPYSQNWNFGAQRQLTNSITLEVNYVGVKGNRLFRVVDGNPPQPNLVSQLLAYCVPGNAFNCSTSTLTFANLWLGQEFGALPFDAVNNNAFESPFSTPGSALNKSIGSSIYHGLQVNLQKRLLHGFQIQGAYTYSHTITDVNDPLNAAAGNRSFPRNSFDLRAERGNSDFDIRHRGVINYIFEPNLGRGRGYLNQGLTGRILEGWSLTGVTEIQTGHPFDIFGSRDSNHTGLSARLSLNGSSTSEPAGKDKTWTGPPLSAFIRTPYDTQPNLAKNRFYGPGMVNFDAAVLKDTGITERLKLQLRFEFFNLFNHAQFAQPANAFSSGSTFGQSSATIGRPDSTTSARQIQVAAKIIF